MSIEWTPTEKQETAWSFLMDKTTTELGYGGGARGGKSWLSITYLIFMCMAYPGTRWLLGRSELKNLKRTSLVTFFNACKTYGLHAGAEYVYNQQEGLIKFSNGSEIILYDLAHSPGDPLYLRLGGLEITGAAIEESNEINVQAINIIKTRVGNCKNADYNIKPIIIETFNPDKGHIYRRYYLPYKNGSIPAHRMFIPALVTDNPFVPQSYIENLKLADEVTKQRLLYGNFDYDDDPSRLMDFRKINDIFYNTHAERGEKFIICDVARFGKDNTTIYVWEGLMITHIYMYAKNSITWLVEKIKELEHEHKTLRSNSIIDEDGVGGGVVDGLPGCRGFMANGKPFIESDQMPNYANLKAQCSFKLANLVNNGQIGCEVKDDTIKETIIEELSNIKRANPDQDDKKIHIIKKEKIKELLGRSPDHGDNFVMRMLPILQSQKFVFLEDPDGVVI